MAGRSIIDASKAQIGGSCWEALVVIPAHFVGNVTMAQVASLIATAVFLVVSLAATRWICRRERLRRARLDVFSRSIQEELAVSGYRALFVSPVVHWLIVVILLREGGEMLPGLIAGGVAGLTAALGQPKQVVA
jgi:hypothetical protein